MNPKALFKILNVYMRYKIKRPVPFTILLRPTFRCNLKCKFCSLWKKSISPELSLGKIKSLVDDASRIGIPYIAMGGGEPLLRKDLEDIAEYIQSKGMLVNLSTNATLIDEKRAQRLVNSFDAIRVSVHGIKDTHDKVTDKTLSFQKMEGGLNHLLKFKKRRAKIGLRFIINKENFKEMKKVHAYFKNKVDFIGFLPEDSIREGTFVNDKALQDWKEISKKIKSDVNEDMIKNIKSRKRLCDAGKLYYTINPGGNVIPCHGLNNCILGNLNQTSFFEIWKKGLDLNAEKTIENCKGCYKRCATEISMLFKKSPFELLKESKKLIKTYF